MESPHLGGGVSWDLRWQRVQAGRGACRQGQAGERFEQVRPQTARCLGAGSTVLVSYSQTPHAPGACGTWLDLQDWLHREPFPRVSMSENHSGWLLTVCIPQRGQSQDLGCTSMWGSGQGVGH